MSHPRIVKGGNAQELGLGDETLELESKGPAAIVQRVQSRQQVPQIRAASAQPNKQLGDAMPPAPDSDADSDAVCILGEDFCSLE